MTKLALRNNKEGGYCMNLEEKDHNTYHVTSKTKLRIWEQASTGFITLTSRTVAYKLEEH